MIGSLQRPLPTQLKTNTTVKRPSPQRNSNHRSQQMSAWRATLRGHGHRDRQCILIELLNIKFHENSPVVMLLLFAGRVAKLLGEFLQVLIENAPETQNPLTGKCMFIRPLQIPAEKREENRWLASVRQYGVISTVCTSPQLFPSVKSPQLYFHKRFTKSKHRVKEFCYVRCWQSGCWRKFSGGGWSITSEIKYRNLHEPLSNLTDRQILKFQITYLHLRFSILRFWYLICCFNLSPSYSPAVRTVCCTAAWMSETSRAQCTEI